MKRLLIVCSHFPPTPSPESNHALLLAEQLAQTGLEVHLLTSPLLPGAPPARGYRLHPEMSTWGWKGLRQFVRVGRRIQPDVVLLIYVGWIYDHHPMITFAPALLRRAGVRARFVTQFENTFGAKTTSRRNRLKWRAAALLAGGGHPTYGSLLTKSDAIIALSERHVDELVAACPRVASKVSMIPAPPLLRIRSDPDGRAREEGRARIGLKAGDPTVVIAFFGYVYAGKGVETLLEALAALKPRLHAKVPFKLIVIGRIDAGLAEPLRTIEERSGLTPEVTWLGHREGEDASTYLWASDIAVLPFDAGVRLNNSSFAVCAIHRMPIVTTRGENMEDTFRHRENVLLCPPKDPSALADVLEEAGTSPELRQRLSAGAAKLAETVFSWDTTVSATLQILSPVAAEKPVAILEPA